jgi:predicted nuclease with TOPRIM domain
MNQHVTRFFIPGASLLGALALAWIAAGFIPGSPMALLMTAVIAAVYVLGLRELAHYRADTRNLHQALSDIPPALEAVAPWLARVPAALQHSVRQRIEGERTALAGPALTPYLVGLLVMLGMLGTFLGMVLTFKGAVFALEGSTDLEAIRSALAAPIKGLGLSFGTSVAGVAASAMLGLVSALSRRERLLTSRLLDQQIAGVLRPFSLAHQREARLTALQQQAQALPAVASQLQKLMEQIEARHDSLSTRLESRQEALHASTQETFKQLAASVSQALQDSLVAGARQAGETMVPVVELAMQQLAAQARDQHQRTHDSLGQQLQDVVAAFRTGTEALNADWAHALADSTHRLHTEWQQVSAQALSQQQAVCVALENSAARITAHTSEQAAAALSGVTRVLERSEALLDAHQQSEATWAASQHSRMDAIAQLWRTELAALRNEEAARGEAATTRWNELSSKLQAELATLRAEESARGLGAAERLSELTGRLRQEMARLDERDTHALQERHQLMERLGTLLESAEASTRSQRDAIDTLVTAAGNTLAQVQTQFGQTLALQSDKAEQLAARVQGSALELSSLGSSFEQAVALFATSNESLVRSLQGIEAAVSQSVERSDEQLAYYVNQAREVIDLSLSAQKTVLEDLRSLRQSGAGASQSST